MEKGSVRIFVWANVIWFLIIFVLCALPGEDIPDPRLNIPHLDKVVHFGMFFYFFAVVDLSFGTQNFSGFRHDIWNCNRCSCGLWRITGGVTTFLFRAEWRYSGFCSGCVGWSGRMPVLSFGKTDIPLKTFSENSFVFAESVLLIFN